MLHAVSLPLVEQQIPTFTSQSLTLASTGSTGACLFYRHKGVELSATLSACYRSNKNFQLEANGPRKIGSSVRNLSRAGTCDGCTDCTVAAGGLCAKVAVWTSSGAQVERGDGIRPDVCLLSRFRGTQLPRKASWCPLTPLSHAPGRFRCSQCEWQITEHILTRLNCGSLAARKSSLKVPKVVSGLCFMPW